MNKNDNDNGTTTNTNNNQITIIVSQSLPTLISMISYTILICFYAQVTYMASGKQRSNFYNITIPWIQNKLAQYIFIIYACIIFCNSVVPILSNQLMDVLIWIIILIFHLCLLISMSYFGVTLIYILDSNVSGGLGLRLIGMCVVCVISFVLRSFIDALELYKVLLLEGQQPQQHGGELNDVIILLPQFSLHYFNKMWNSSFGRDVMGYIMLEWVPAIIVLAMMHKSPSKQSTNHINNLDVSNTNSYVAGRNLPRNYTSHDDSLGGGAGVIMEGANEFSVVYEQQPTTFDIKGKTGGVGGGVTRSFSANGGVPGGHKQQQQPSNQRAFPSSFGMKRIGSGLGGSSGSGRGDESTALLGDRDKHHSYSGMSSQGDV
jgi:hypothetical protein